MSLFVFFVLLSVAFATSLPVYECGTLRSSFTTYRLARNIAVENVSYGYVCFDIIGAGITLDGNGYELTSASNKLLYATGVQYSAENVVVKNMQISNMRTGILAKGKHGEVSNNTIRRGVNGIDVSATNNKITNNVIGEFEADESTSGVYVYFPAIKQVESFIDITNNVISDISGDTFALGISVYYATSVSVANNFIYNIKGGLSGKEISVMSGKIEAHDNSFNPPPSEGGYTQLITIFASAFTLLASVVFYYASAPRTSPTVTFLPPKPAEFTFSAESDDESEDEDEEKSEEEREKAQEEKKRQDKEEYEKEKPQSPKTMSFHLGSSPIVR